MLHTHTHTHTAHRRESHSHSLTYSHLHERHTSKMAMTATWNTTELLLNSSLISALVTANRAVLVIIANTDSTNNT